LTLLTSTARTQDFKYGIQTSFVKFDIHSSPQDARLFPTDYYDGYEVGGLVFYNPKPSPFHFYTGLSYNILNYQYYNLSYATLPLGLNIHIGNKAGVFLGPGIKCRILIDASSASHDFNQFLFSYTAQLGVFFTIKSLNVQLYPQLEFVKTPVYNGVDWRGTVDYNLYMTTYNLVISF
jgi:hypothetical protein